MSIDLAYYVGNELSAQQRIDMRTADRPIEDLDMGTYVHSHPYPIKFVHMVYKFFWIHNGESKKEEFYREGWNELKAQGSSLPKDESGSKTAWNCYCPNGLAGLSPKRNRYIINLCMYKC